MWGGGAAAQNSTRNRAQEGRAGGSPVWLLGRAVLLMLPILLRRNLRPQGRGSGGWAQVWLPLRPLPHAPVAQQLARCPWVVIVTDSPRERLQSLGRGWGGDWSLPAWGTMGLGPAGPGTRWGRPPGQGSPPWAPVGGTEAPGLRL